MIVKMTRYDFVLFHADVEAFLVRLRELGIVDITLKDFEMSEANLSEVALSDRYAKIAREMGSIKQNALNLQPFDAIDDAVNAFDSATIELKQIADKKHSLAADAKKVSVWGEFQTSSIEELKGSGIVLRFFETPTKNYSSEWEYEYAISVISQENGQTFFVVAVGTEDAAKVLDIKAIELPAPVFSASQIEAEIERLTQREVELQEIRERASLSREAIKERVQELLQNTDFVKVNGSAQSEVDGSIKILEGWSDAADRVKIEEFANQMEVLYTAQDAKEEQNPPIKLKNNFFARLYEPIGALYMNPRYNELDLTPFFAPFFMIFFGMCFADAGYGLLLIIATIALWKKIPANFKDFGWLIIFLNIAAVIFGFFSGNMFGIELMKIEALANFKEMFLTPNDVFYLSVLIGGCQVLFGLILRTFNRIKRGGKFVYGVSNIGWLILIVSSIVAMTGVAPEVYDSASLAYEITLYFAIALILFFSVPGKPFVSIGKGLYSFYEMATGVVGDLISYVRLFAIGLAGTIIAQVFNELSIGLSGDIPVVSLLIMIVILAIGHGLNIFLSVLGGMVHPIRLTFVEFYKNAEFEGGGRKFTPFKLRINKTK